MGKYSGEKTKYGPKRIKNPEDYDIDREDGEYSFQGDDGVYYYKIDYAAVKYDVFQTAPDIPAAGAFADSAKDSGDGSLNADILTGNIQDPDTGTANSDVLTGGSPDIGAGVSDEDNFAGDVQDFDTGAANSDVLTGGSPDTGAGVSVEDNSSGDSADTVADTAGREKKTVKKKSSHRIAVIIAAAAVCILAAFLAVFFLGENNTGNNGNGTADAETDPDAQTDANDGTDAGKPVVVRALTDSSTLEDDVFSTLTYSVEGVTYTRNVVEQTAEEPLAKNEATYVIKVNLATCVVTVYSAGTDGAETPVRSFACSPARDPYATPEGEFIIGDNAIWCLLEDSSEGQYALFITGDIEDGYLFHSVPYNTMDKGDLEWAEYNKLGSPASLGCIRVSVINARWLCENVGFGTKLVIYSDEDDDGPFGLPAVYFIPETVTETRGWDPTDPDPENPWHTYDFTLEVDSDAARSGITLKAGDTFDIRDYVTATDTYGHDLAEYVTYTAGDLQYGFSYETYTLEELQAEGLEDISQEDLISYDFTNITFNEEGTYELEVSLNIGPLTAQTVINVTVK